EFGHSLAGQIDPLRDPTEAGFSENDQNGGVTVYFPLNRPAGMGKTLKSLKLSVPVALAVRKPEPLAITAYTDIDSRRVVMGDLLVMARKQPFFAGTGPTITLGIRGNLDPSPDICDDQFELVDARGHSLVASASGGNMMVWGGGIGRGFGGRAFGRNM